MKLLTKMQTLGKEQAIVLFGQWTAAYALAQWAAEAVGAHAVIAALIALMAIDWVTGVAAAWINGEIESSKGGKGMAKKGLVLCLILSSHIIEKAYGQEWNLETWGATGYLFTEFVSIVENVDRAGGYVPAVLVQALARVKGTAGRRATAEEIAKLHDEQPNGN